MLLPALQGAKLASYKGGGGESIMFRLIYAVSLACVIAVGMYAWQSGVRPTLTDGALFGLMAVLAYNAVVGRINERVALLLVFATAGVLTFVRTGDLALTAIITVGSVVFWALTEPGSFRVRLTRREASE